MSSLSTLMTPSGFILVGALLSAFGAVFGALGAILAANDQARFERELREKSDEIAQLNRRALHAVTGGDSFCYLSLAYLSPTSNYGKLVLVQQGEFPLYDVGVRIVDLEKLRELEDRLSFETMKYTDTNIELGNLSPQSARILRDWTLGPGASKAYNIFFSARNGFFSQLLRLALVDGQWVTATQVKRDEEVLLEKIDEKFPRNADGQVEW